MTKDIDLKRRDSLRSLIAVTACFVVGAARGGRAGTLSARSLWSWVPLPAVPSTSARASLRSRSLALWDSP